MDVMCSRFDSPLLPPRQLEILQLARRGKSFQDITDTLGISENTLRWYVSQIRRVLPAFDTVDADADPDCLTTREREIALLVAEGLSNCAICARLKVSPYTLSNHLRHVYRKTGAANRVQLAMRAGGTHRSARPAHAEG